MIEVMLSPGSIGSRLTNALPREFGVPTGRRQTFMLVGLAARGEEQHRRVGVGDEHPGDEILVLGRHAGAALAAAALGPVDRQRRPLDLAAHG